MAAIQRITSAPRVVGVSRLGKAALGVGAAGAGVAAYRKRKQLKAAAKRVPAQLKRARWKFGRVAGPFRVGATSPPALGPLRYESKQAKRRAAARGDAKPQRIPAATVGKALKYGAGSVAAGEVTGPIAAGIGHSLFGVPGLAGEAIGRLATYGVGTVAYARARRREAAAVRKAGTGARSAG